jgi:hypothetical protein
MYPYRWTHPCSPPLRHESRWPGSSGQRSSSPRARHRGGRASACVPSDELPRPDDGGRVPLRCRGSAKRQPVMWPGRGSVIRGSASEGGRALPIPALPCCSSETWTPISGFAARPSPRHHVRAQKPVRAIASRPVNWEGTLQALVQRPGDEGEGPTTSLADVVMWAPAAAYA